MRHCAVAGWGVPLILGYQKSGAAPTDYHAGVLDGAAFEPQITAAREAFTAFMEKRKPEFAALQAPSPLDEGTPPQKSIAQGLGSYTGDTHFL